MTIIYQYKVATASFFGFFKLLSCWKGSVYKLMFKETIVFSALYAVISITYRVALNSQQKNTFEKIAAYCNSYTSLIPVSFVLGFYVSVVVTRWWQQFTNVPWPDRTLFIMGTYLHGDDERARIMRRTVARYMMFGQILILRSISVAVMKRFPTMEHIVDAGFVSNDEVLVYDRVHCKYNKFWVPLVWANNVLTQAKKEGKIDSDIGFRLIIEQLADFRDKCSLCFVFDWITIPLVYTQVVTLAVYMFFAACLIGRQYVDNVDEHPDLYFPMFTLLQFFFYMGWLKVAEQLINPFGEDEDDFDMNWLIDRHTAVAMCLVDQCHGTYPTLVRDAHYNEITTDLPYTEASLPSKRENFLGSTYNLARPSIQEQRVVTDQNGVPTHGLRYRAFTGPTTRVGSGSSVWSLFGGFKSNLHKSSFTGSRDTFRSSSTLANGHAGFGPLSSPTIGTCGDGEDASETQHYGPNELPPEYIPLRRARASTDVEHRPLARVIDNDRERKWSFPLSLLRRKQGKGIYERTHSCDITSNASLDSNQVGDSTPLLQQPQPQTPTTRTTASRFVVESVPGDHDVDSSKHARNKQLIDMHIGHMSLSVSRAPVLSAIEEGNTIRSLKELSPHPSSHSLEQQNDSPDDLPTATQDIPSTIEEVDDVFEEQPELFEMSNGTHGAADCHSETHDVTDTTETNANTAEKTTESNTKAPEIVIRIDES